MVSPGRYWRTLRHLTLRQLVFQLWYRLLPSPSMSAFPEPLEIETGPYMFCFLNQRVHFPERIDWNYARNGKLWTYQLTYFEYLNIPEPMPAKEGLTLIRAFMGQTSTIRAGLEPYPTSLRIQHWAWFLRRNRLQDSAIDDHLLAQTRLLQRRLEYHLAGNHLLENGFALLTAGLYFRRPRWFWRAARLVRVELARQILSDGGHDERSPVYHQAILQRLANLAAMLRADTWHGDADLVKFLDEKAGLMRTWLAAVTFRNGDVPGLNDCVAVVRTTPDALAVGFKTVASGYRLFRRERYELLTDTGAVGPDHQPGHAHADTFSFLLYVDGAPLLVDTGTSTYEPGPRRQWERSTAAHNTVEVAGQSSSEVWASFRVGRRARVTVLSDTDNSLTARHDGYRHLGLWHERSWTLEPHQIQITDRLIYPRRGRRYPAIARFYLHPDVAVQLLDTGAVAGPARFLFASDEPLAIRLAHCQLADGFNRLRPSHCLEVTFTTTLNSTIQLVPFPA